ncbi:hypothetical protein OTU49_009944, partial [Cherax quadricarinatus]
AWELVTAKCMKGVWKQCNARFLQDFHGFDSEEELSVLRGVILKLANKLELECDVDDIEELLTEEVKELTNEELLIIEERKAEEQRQKDDEENEEEPERKFSVNELSQCFSLINQGL